MPDLILNGDYESLLGLRETERAIKFIKDYFQDHLAEALNLQRVSAPLFLRKGSGINDDLNGVEAKAGFRIKDDGYSEAECLFSLAKWKRMVLADYGFAPGEGLYTDMNAIRPDEECLDNGVRGSVGLGAGHRRAGAKPGFPQGDRAGHLRRALSDGGGGA